MTFLMRFAMVGMIATGVAVYAFAQDEDLDNLLNDLIEDVEPDKPAEPPAKETPAPAPEAKPEAQPDVKPAEEPAGGGALLKDIVDDTAPAPAAEPEKVAEPTPEPAPEPEVKPAEEPAAGEDDLDKLLDDMGNDSTPAPAEPTPAPAPEPAPEPEPTPEEVTPAPEPAPAPAPEVVPAEEPEEVTPAPEEKTAEPTPPAPAKDAMLGTMTDDSEVVQQLTEEERALNDLEMLIQLKNKGLEAHAMACLEKARELMDPQNPPEPGKAFDQYKAAIKMYEDAQKYFRERESNLPLREECEKGKREARYRQAVSLFQDREYKKALDLAQQVQREGHPFGAKLAAQIQEEVNRPVEIRPTPVLPEYAKDEYKVNRLQIQERIKRAAVYYHLSKYKEANDQLELVLRDDPSNESAINLRARVVQRLAARNRQLKASTHDEMIAQVEGQWTPLGALGRNSEELYNPVVSRGETKKVDDSGQKDTEIVMAKLQYIRLPEFNIRPPSTLADAVQFFAEVSKSYDKPELPPEEKGVSFVLNMGTPAAQPAASEESDPFATEASASSSGLPPIQGISMTYVTLKEALDMVCEVTGSTYVVKGRAVVVVPASYVDSGKTETRTYNVMSSIIERVNQIGSEVGSSSSSGSDDGWGDFGSSSSGSSGGSATSDMWKKTFTDLGVPFEGKASIVYLPSIGKLRVTNTPDNLAKIESLLEELNVTPCQIEVEARFVEVSQTDLNSLGFEWQLNSDIVGTVGSGIDWASSAIRGNSNGGTAAGGTSADGRHIFRPSASSGTGKANVGMHGGSLNNGMRFLGDGSVYANRINLANSAVAPDDTFASFSAVFGKVDMTMILHMLAQRSDTDMLSSPKVVVRPDQEAVIKVVTEWIYPTEFDITELEESDINYDNNNTSVVGGNSVTVTAPPVKFAVEPQSFEKQEVGVSLQVIPQLSQEGQMINLAITPRVVEYLGDFEYGMQVPYIQYGMTGGVVTSAEVAYYNVSMPQPKFHLREVSTVLSVYNGSTVVMGGLITEARKSFEDKVPLLGDLPFIGFLFRSTGEYSEKRNLLIFLTARLVDPAGRPLKTATDGRTGTALSDSSQNTETMSSTAK